MTLHPGQFTLRTDTVRELLRSQCPHLAHLPLERVDSWGTVNIMFALGEHDVVRVPMQPHGRAAVRHEASVSATVAPALAQVVLPSGGRGIALPELVHLGTPSSIYPCEWTVYRWIDGISCDRIPERGTQADAEYLESAELGHDLAAAIRALRALPTEGRTWVGEGRGGPLASVDEFVRLSLERSRPLRDEMGGALLDLNAISAEWDRALAASPAPRELWTHNDLMPGNLVLHNSRLAGMIDWGAAGVADPAVDLQPAWNLLGSKGRAALREDLHDPADPDAWLRGRGWAIAQAMGCVWYYAQTLPPMSRLAVHTLEQVLEDA